MFMMRKFFREEIQGISAYRTAKHVECRIKLMSNENNYPSSKKVLRAIASYSPNRYPDPIARELRKRISEYLSEEKGVQVKEDWVVAFSGGDDGIRTILGVFLERGTNIVSYSPTFPVYEIGAKYFGAEWRAAPLNKDFSFDDSVFAQMEKRIDDKTRLIAICNPNNPTGTPIKRAYIEKLIQKGIPIIVDEAYFEFSGDTVMDLANRYENLIILRTLSKSFGLAGLRVGYTVNKNSHFIDALLKTKAVFNVNGPAQAGAIAALSEKAHMKKNVGKIIEERERLLREIPKFFKTYPSKANFILVSTSPFSDDEFVERLIEREILVRGIPPDFARITMGTKKENDELLKALKKMKEKSS